MEKKENREQELVAEKPSDKTAGRVAEKAPYKTAVVVGASSGIGKEAALMLASKGYRVINVSRTPCKGEKVKSISADAAQEGELKKAIADAAENGGIDLLIYSAGFSMSAPLEYAKSGDYRYLFEVNYFGAIEAIKAALPYLKKRGGRAILVGSLAGDIPVPYDGFYSASKAALVMLAREANMELRGRGVRVSALLPGGTATDFTYNRMVYKDEATEYAGSVKKASAALANMEQGGMSASLVAGAIVKLAERKNPPPVVSVGPKNSFVRFMNRVLPAEFVDRMVMRKFNQK
ncbi:MAG: SDR family NAD(P)-dependent oxidoreductase [Clostridia bacterium]|jgi:short-subunit dehydrogenase|nr:SDR family NAD(P)-dependent oxidoreductase [Clostridia bacterium]